MAIVKQSRCLFFWVILLAPMIGAVLPAGSAEEGKVVIQKLNLRPSPSVKEKPLTTLNKGDRFTVLAHQKEWIKISFKNHVGYVKNKPRYVFLVPVAAKTDSKKNAVQKQISQIRQQAQTIQDQIKTTREHVAEISDREKKVIDQLNEIDKQLNATRRHAKKLTTEKKELENVARKTGQKIEQLQKTIDRQRQQASTRLVSLYKLNRVGRFQMIIAAESVHDLLRRKSGMEKILGQDMQLIASLMENYQVLAAVQSERQHQMLQLVQIETRLEEQLENQAREKRLRSQLLSEIKSKRSLEQAALEALHESSRQLDETIEKLQKAYLARTNGEDASEKIPFSALKGLLPAPVKGRIVSRFGPYMNPAFKVMNFRSGVEISSDRGEPVHAVSSGQVLFADWFKGFGNMIIINHGDSYYTVYAHIEEIFKSKGARVEPREVIATVGDTGSQAGARLYFEVRHRGTPEDPLLWIKVS